MRALQLILLALAGFWIGIIYYVCPALASVFSVALPRMALDLGALAVVLTLMFLYGLLHGVGTKQEEPT